MRLKWIFISVLFIFGVLNADARKARESDKSKKPVAAAKTSAKAKKKAKPAVAEPDAGAMEGYFPKDGTMRSGQTVRIVHTWNGTRRILDMHRRAKNLTPEELEAFKHLYSQWAPFPYNATIWPDTKDYDKYVEEWNKAQLVPMEPVSVGLQDAGEGMWRLNSTKGETGNPMVISSLKYDAKRNVWISGNYELTAHDYAISGGPFGVQNGTKWSIMLEDDKTCKAEELCITKSPDGKCAYLTYESVVGDAASKTAQSGVMILLQFKDEDEEKSTPAAH